MSAGGLKCGAVGGPPVDLIVSVQWLSITAINTMEQTFEAELDISFTCRDGVELIDPTFTGPNVKVTNAINIEVINDSTRGSSDGFEEDGPLAIPGRQGAVQNQVWHPVRGNDHVWQLHIRGSFAAPFELSSFPIDVQELGVSLQPAYAVLVPGPQVSSKQRVRFILADGDDLTPATLVKQGMIVAPLLCKLQRLSVYIGHTARNESKRGNVYSKVYTSVIVERRWGYFFWNVVFPCGLFTTMEFLSLLVPRNDLADRLSVTITLLLTLTAYKIISAQSVPDVPYLTMLDNYVVGCTLFSFLVAGQNGLASAVLIDDDELDFISGITLLGLWLLFNLYTCFRWLRIRRRNVKPSAGMALARAREPGVPIECTIPDHNTTLDWSIPLSKDGGIAVEA